MSLNKLTNIQKGKDLQFQIGCDTLDTSNLFSENSEIDELKVFNFLTIGATIFDGVDAAAGSVLTTNGAGLLSLEPPANAPVVQKDVVLAGNYSFGVGSGAISEPLSIHEQNGTYIQLSGSVKIDNLLASTFSNGMSIVSLDITVPDTIAYPSVANSIISGGGSGFAAIGTARNIFNVNISRLSSTSIRVVYNFLGDITSGAGRTGYLSWFVFYEKA
jgi:hypothetical protein